MAGCSSSIIHVPPFSPPKNIISQRFFFPPKEVSNGTFETGLVIVRSSGSRPRQGSAALTTGHRVTLRGHDMI